MFASLIPVLHSFVSFFIFLLWCSSYGGCVGKGGCGSATTFSVEPFGASE